MKIDVEDLVKDPGRKATFAFTVDQRELDLRPDEGNFGDFQITAELESTSRGLLGRFSVAGSAQLSCSRCLDEFTWPIAFTFEQEWRKQLASSGNEIASWTGEEEEILPFDGRSIEVGEILRDRVLLSLPMKPLCQPDCRGLCPVCGANLNYETCTCQREEVDPRLMPLTRWRKVERD